MKFVGIRKDKETEELVKYELNIYKQDVSCLYKDRYGVYICTLSGRMYKVDHSLSELKEELCL